MVSSVRWSRMGLNHAAELHTTPLGSREGILRARGNHPPLCGTAITAKAREARAVLVEQAKARAVDLTDIVKELQAAGCASLRAIAAGLKERGIPTPRGGNWSAVQVARLLDRLDPFAPAAASA
jgi:hypothetical protein